MIKELKTLKDLNGKIKGHFEIEGKKVVVGGNLDNPEPTYINEDVLRQELAIPWIKHLLEEAKTEKPGSHKEQCALAQAHILMLVFYIAWKELK